MPQRMLSDHDGQAIPIRHRHVLCFTLASAIAFAWLSRDKKDIRELGLGSVIQLVDFDDDAYAVEFEAFALFEGTLFEYERMKSCLRSNPRLMKTVSQSVTLTRRPDVWSGNDLSTLQADFHREIQAVLGESSIIGVGFKR